MPSSGGAPFKVAAFGALGTFDGSGGGVAGVEGNGRRHC
jgi:hypothetical protein